MTGPAVTLDRRGFLVGAAAAGVATRAPATARKEYSLTPREVADGVWMIEGTTEYFSRENGGDIVNIVFLRTDAGALLIDTGSTRRHGAAIRAAVAETAPLGVSEVLITHHHPDHWFGNQVFGDVALSATPETRALCAERGELYSDALYRLLGDWMLGSEPAPPGALAALGQVEIGGRALRLTPLSGHTVSDLAILDEATGTLIAGDLAFLDRAPTTPDADLPAWRKSLDALEALQAGGIAPGHGPFDRTGASLRQTRAYLDWLDETLTAGAEGGLDQMEVILGGVDRRFAGMGAMPQEFSRSVAHLFPLYEAQALPLVQ
jgi:quinoprotein relay system zinc metallohydrolase 1